MKEHDSELQKEVKVEIGSKPSSDYRVMADAVLGIVKRNMRIKDMESDRETVHVMVDKLVKQAEAGRVDRKTGLPNWQVFDRDFYRLADQARRGDFKLAMMLIDIDGLKRLNDDETRGGHRRGDDLIKTVANTLTESVRGSDRVYRLEGGDEFMVLLQLHNRDIQDDFLSSTKKRFSSQLDHSLSDGQFPQDLHLGASVGFGIFDADENIQNFFDRVEKDTYVHKATRRAELEALGEVFQDPRLLSNGK